MCWWRSLWRTPQTKHDRSLRSQRRRVSWHSRLCILCKKETFVFRNGFLTRLQLPPSKPPRARNH